MRCVLMFLLFKVAVLIFGVAVIENEELRTLLDLLLVLRDPVEWCGTRKIKTVIFRILKEEAFLHLA